MSSRWFAVGDTGHKGCMKVKGKEVPAGAAAQLALRLHQAGEKGLRTASASPLTQATMWRSTTLSARRCCKCLRTRPANWQRSATRCASS